MALVFRIKCMAPTKGRASIETAAALCDTQPPTGHWENAPLLFLTPQSAERVRAFLNFTARVTVLCILCKNVTYFRLLL